MHPGVLAFLSSLFLSIVCFLTGGIWLMIWTRSRSGYMLPSALSWWALCIYFGMLAVSAGSAPAVTRGDIALMIRLWGFAVGALVLGAKITLLCVWWRAGRRTAAPPEIKIGNST